jgi:hypothetical protein
MRISIIALPRRECLAAASSEDRRCCPVAIMDKRA